MNNFIVLLIIGFGVREENESFKFVFIEAKLFCYSRSFHIHHPMKWFSP